MVIAKSADSQKLNRRHFLKLVAGMSASVTLASTGIASADTKRFGKLVDSVRCIGCKRCMSACKRWNKLEVERDELVTDRETHLSSQNWVVVNLRSDNKNQTHRNFFHWACQYCIEPACVGVCPVTAISKLRHGPVVINEKKCIGCRYCYQACPWKIPQFDFGKRVTRKCTLCFDRIPLNYKKPACVAACPVGALAFDYRLQIVKEAHRRISRLKIPSYIMGLREAGGTSLISILPAMPGNLGFVEAPKKVVNHNLDKIRITASGLLASSVIAMGMYFYAQVSINRKFKSNEHTTEI